MTDTERILKQVWSEMVSKPDEDLVELIVNKIDRMCGYKVETENVTGFLRKVASKWHLFDRLSSLELKPSPNTEFYVEDRIQNAVIEILGDLGGKATMKRILSKVNKNLDKSGASGQLKSERSLEREMYEVKARLIKRGFVKQSIQKTWELTEEGWRYYQALKRC